MSSEMKFQVHLPTFPRPVCVMASLEASFLFNVYEALSLLRENCVTVLETTREHLKQISADKETHVDVAEFPQLKDHLDQIYGGTLHYHYAQPELSYHYTPQAAGSMDRADAVLFIFHDLIKLFKAHGLPFSSQRKYQLKGHPKAGLKAIPIPCSETVDGMAKAIADTRANSMQHLRWDVDDCERKLFWIWETCDKECGCIGEAVAKMKQQAPVFKRASDDMELTAVPVKAQRLEQATPPAALALPAAAPQPLVVDVSVTDFQPVTPVQAGPRNSRRGSGKSAV